MRTANPHPTGIEVAIEDLLWLTRGRHWDFEFILAPDDIRLLAGRAILERLRNEGVGHDLPIPPGAVVTQQPAEAQPRMLCGELEDPMAPAAFVASSWLESDPELRDSAGRPVHHSLVWFRRAAEGTRQFVQGVPGNWNLQILEFLKPAFRKVFDLPEELVRGWRADERPQSFGQHLREILRDSGYRPGTRIMLVPDSAPAPTESPWIDIGTLYAHPDEEATDHVNTTRQLDFSWQGRRWDWRSPPAKLCRSMQDEIGAILRWRLRELLHVRGILKKPIEHLRRALWGDDNQLLVEELPVLFDGRKGDSFLEGITPQARKVKPPKAASQGFRSRLSQRTDFSGIPNAGREAIAHLLAKDVHARRWLRELPESDGCGLVAALLAHGAVPEDRCVEAIYVRARYLSEHHPP